ncbi:MULTISPECIES: hypothetical protein [unclassified Lysinibacillus]|uniref:hypothetical protein n=1 Tax=unclassified Lysinibacillus TaxID=2636778 RepID=UPI00380B1D3E
MKKLFSMLATVILSFSLVGTAFASESVSQETETIIPESTQIENDSTVGEVVNTSPEISLEDYGIQPMYLWNTVISNGYQGLSYGAWVDGVSGSGAATLTLAKTVGVSNTFSGTLTAKKDDITAAVGFSITWTDTTTASYSVQVPAGKKYKIQYRSVYKKYKATQTTYSTDIGSTVVLGTDIIYPMQYQYLEYRYVEI